MNKKLGSIALSLFLCGGTALAQNAVSGTVVDENGEPVVGASVIIKGTRLGVVTDVDGKFVINPSVEESEKSLINLTVAGTSDAINMVESSAHEVSEDLMLDALMFGHENVKKLCEFENEIIAAPLPFRKSKCHTFTLLHNNIILYA